MAETVRTVARFVFGHMLPRTAYPVLRGPLRGARFILGSLGGEGGGASVYFGLIEPEQTASLAATLKPGDVFFDIGANVGYYTLLGARLVGPRGRVLALEPAARNIAFLYRHIVLNRTSNVTIVPAACSDQVSVAVFAAGENFATGHIAAEPARNTHELPSLVPTVTVDSLSKSLGTSPAVIKIDVEGAELDVLEGARCTLSASRPVIFLSVHSPELRVRCLELLRGLSYAVEALRPNESEPTEFRAVSR